MSKILAGVAIVLCLIVICVQPIVTQAWAETQAMNEQSSKLAWQHESALTIAMLGTFILIVSIGTRGRGIAVLGIFIIVFAINFLWTTPLLSLIWPGGNSPNMPQLFHLAVVALSVIGLYPIFFILTGLCAVIGYPLSMLLCSRRKP